MSAQLGSCFPASRSALVEFNSLHPYLSLRNCVIGSTFIHPGGANVFWWVLWGTGVREESRGGAKVTVEIEGYSGSAGRLRVKHKCRRCVSAGANRQSPQEGGHQHWAGTGELSNWSLENARKSFFFFFTCTKGCNVRFIHMWDLLCLLHLSSLFWNKQDAGLLPLTANSQLLEMLLCKDGQQITWSTVCWRGLKFRLHKHAADLLVLALFPPLLLDWDVCQHGVGVCDRPGGQVAG